MGWGKDVWGVTEKQSKTGKPQAEHLYPISCLDLNTKTICPINNIVKFWRIGRLHDTFT